MTAGPTIDYDALAQEAMRGLVRTVLARTAKTGLPGDHHFYISFDTQAVGVVMSKRLKDKYPQEMTIVLQHRFWDLIVTEERFEVKLTFDGIPERLVIPFSAIKVFFDPSVSYGLQFDDPDAAGRHQGDDDGERRPAAMTTRSSSPRKPRSPRNRAGRDQDGAELGDAPQKPAAEPARAAGPTLARVAPNGAHVGGQNGEPKPEKGDKGDKGKEKPAAEKQGSDKQPAASEPGIEAANKPSAPAAGAQIVSLDAFRKK